MISEMLPWLQVKISPWWIDFWGMWSQSRVAPWSYWAHPTVFRTLPPLHFSLFGFARVNENPYFQEIPKIAIVSVQKFTMMNSTSEACDHNPELPRDHIELTQLFLELYRFYIFRFLASRELTNSWFFRKTLPLCRSMWLWCLIVMRLRRE